MNNKGNVIDNKLNCSFISHFNNSWVIDSGVIDHMTDNLILLQNKINATKCPLVTIVNDSKVPIEQICTTKLFSNNIFNVFYLPTFTSNLLSVSKITKELNYNVIFSSNNVIFQDIVTKKTIGEENLNNGLYYLDTSNKALVASHVDKNKL
jgi:hypothetical protein